MAKATAAPQTKPNIFIQAKVFMQEVKTEMDKVTWPTREDLKASTSVVLIFLAIMAVMVGVLDVIFQNVVLALLRIF